MRKNKMKIICLSALLIAVCFAIGCDLTSKSTVSENKSSSSGEIARAANSAAPNVALTNAAPLNSQTSSANKPANNAQKVQTNESLPRKISEDTAVSPVYAFNSKNCERQATDDFVYKCKAYGDYILTGGGYDGINNYTIEPKNADAGFFVDLMPLAEGDAKEFLRNDKFVQKLGDKITWLLDDKGKPYAIFVHASFYKAAGGAKTFDNPKNKVAEFVFLRGLSVSEDLDHDIQAVDTAYNPDEWARKIAYEVREQNKK